MARGNTSSRRGRGKARKTLKVEPLESRELLAADLGIGGVSFNNDPFAHDAFPVDEIALRAETTRYMENELVVAFNFGSSLGASAAAIDADFWAAELSETIVSSWSTTLEYQRDNGSVIMMVDLLLEPGVDPVNVMKDLDSNPDIAWSSPNFLYDGEDPRELVPNDPRYDEQYHHPLMQNDLAWDIVDFGSSEIVIAVTDDGVSLDHSDLADNIWQNPGEIAGDNIDNDGNGFVDDVSGWSFIDGNNDPNPSSLGGHGTHVAGIAAGRTDNNIGIAGTAGNATVMPIQFFDYAEWPATVIRDSFVYATDNDAHIVSTSYNIDIWVGDPVFTAGVQYAHDSGLLYFNSAGNGSDTNPARQAFEQPLLVASTTSTDELSDFSNRGTGIDIAAPGSDILSTIPGNTYDLSSGTSMATPNAAGVAALIWSQNPTWNSYQVAAQLIGTADNIDAQNPSFVGLVGGGRANSFQALTETLAPPQVRGTLGVPNNGGVTEDVTISEFSVQFDSVLDPVAAINPASYELTNAGPDGVFDTGDDESLALNITSLYMVGSNEVDLELASGGSLEIGDYRLSVTSGGIVDPFGTALDGNADGIAGDDYVAFFSVANPFKGEGPDPGLISKRTDVSASLSGAADSDVITFFAEAGETVTAIATPTNASASLTLTVPFVTDATAASPGGTVILPIATIPSDGEYEFIVNGDAATTYSLEIYRNVDVEGLVEGGVVDLSGSEIDLGGSRYAALASANGVPPGVSFDQYNSPGAFIDISLSGTSLGLGDDGEADITSSVGNLLMPAGPMTIGNNGVLAQGAGVGVPFANASIPTANFNAALMPFWDDIDSTAGDVYWEERVVGGIDTLIVQWDTRPHFSDLGDATFQIQLFDSGPVLARYAYADVDFGDPEFDGGGSATIGAQSNSLDGFEYSNNEAVVAAGDVIDVLFTTATNDVDEFTVELSAVGENVDIVLDGATSRFSDAMVELLDPSGSVVATASPTSSSYELGILGHTITQAGQYTVRVTSEFSGQYYLLVNESLAYSTEPDNTVGTARDLTNYSGALGSLSGEVVSFSQYSDANLFVDISGTGTALGLDDDEEASVSTTVGNDVFPAGTITIGNNGVVAAGAGVQVSAGNAALPSTDFGTALIPFWDDIDDETGDVYWEETVIDGVSALIVQWNDRPHFASTGGVGEVTFQVQVFESGPVPVRYAYSDVTFGDATFDFGASATIGYQSSSTTGEAFIQNSPSVFGGDVIDITVGERDMFQIDVVQGETIGISTGTPFDDPRNEPLNNRLDVAIQVLDVNGNLLASDLNSAADGRNATVDFTAGFTGTAFVSVELESGEGEYVLSIDDGSVQVNGDFDNDGDYDCNDIDALVGEIAGNSNNMSFDLTGDGMVDLNDRDAWLAEAGSFNGLASPYLLGDATLDGFVDVSDFNIWNSSKFTNTAEWCSGDFNADGAVDVSDFNDWNANKFNDPLVVLRNDTDFATPRSAVSVGRPVAGSERTQVALPELIAYSPRELSSANTINRSSLIDRVFATTVVDLEDDRWDAI